jgi:phage terminase large subunit GpA-like protein
MDAVSDPEVETVVGMFSSQVGKTTMGENVIGYYVDQDPSPILVVRPTLDLAEAFSKDRLAPLVRDTDCLAEKIGDPRSRDGGNTLLHKIFPGGHITLAGANSPASLADRSIRVLLCDEVDRFPPSAGTEGDPVALAKKRTTAFWNRKIVLISSPGTKGVSRIEAAYEEGDQRRFHVPCPHCGAQQHLKWQQVVWPEGRPQEAAYKCEAEGCGTLWSDAERWLAVEQGAWVAEAEFTGTASFHLNEIYSSWVPLAQMAKNFLEAKPHVERLKVFINTSLAETWEEDAEQLDEHVLAGRAEDWGEKAPEGVLVATAGVDVQDDRLEVETVGWGSGEESWSLEHRIIYGDPSAPYIWNQLDELLLTRIRTRDGRELPISCAAVDTGGHYTAAASAFCKPRFRRRVYAIKGRGGQGHPVWPKRASKNNKARVNLFLVGVDAAKDMVIARLKTREPGPGYCHFPAGRDAEYFKQFTAEKVKTKHVKGFPVRVYEKDPGKRNEALDLRVYAYAALVALNVSWGRLLAAKEEAARPQKDLFTSDRKPPPEHQVDSNPPPAPAVPQQQPRSARRVVRSSFMAR